MLSQKIGKKIQKIDGVEVRINDNCIGCGTCTEGICFVDAIRIENERAQISEECRGCGRCVEICPQEAIEFKINDETYISRAIKQIEKIIDVS